MSSRTLLLGLLAVPILAHAGDADVCYGPSAPAGITRPLTADTVLACPKAGQHSLAQLAQAGWSIVSAQPVVLGYGADPKTHLPAVSSAIMVIVQK